MLSWTANENRKRIDEHRDGYSLILHEVLNGQTEKVSSLKSLQAKIAFLTSAIERMDTNLVTCAVLHMRNTLSRRLFHQQLVNRPVAEDAYINYLRLTEQTDLMLDFLTMTGRPEDAAIAKLKHCLVVSGVETRVRMLRNCRQNFFSSTERLEFWGSLIEDEATLLERQLPIEEDDRRMESQPTSEYNAKFLEIPRKPLPELPVVTTLFYCCLYHWDLPENYLSSPASIRKAFNLSEKQFAWTALSALSMRKRWDLVDSLFQGKTWLGIRKSRVCLPYHEIAATLIRCVILFRIFSFLNLLIFCYEIRYEAPPEVVNKYALLIEDLETRKEFAEQHKLSKVLKCESSLLPE